MKIIWHKMRLSPSFLISLINNTGAWGKNWEERRRWIKRQSRINIVTTMARSCGDNRDNSMWKLSFSLTWEDGSGCLSWYSWWWLLRYFNSKGEKEEELFCRPSRSWYDMMHCNSQMIWSHGWQNSPERGRYQYIFRMQYFSCSWCDF